MDSRPSDESLLLAVAERDLGAFRTLYERHAGWLAIRLARLSPEMRAVIQAVVLDGLWWIVLARCAVAVAIFQSVAEGCPGGCPEFHDSGDIHCAGRPAAPSTLLS